MGTSPQDKWELRLQNLNSSPHPQKGVVDSLVFVQETLDASKLICESIFGEGSADTEVVFDIYDLVVARQSQLTNESDE